MPSIQSNVFSEINYLVSKAMSQNRLMHPTQTLDYDPGESLSILLARLAEEGMLQWTPQRARDVTFVSSESAAYIGGIWLEEFAYLQIRQAGLENIEVGVTVTWQNSKKDASHVNNEFDLLVTHRNRLLVVECKSGRVSAQKQAGQDHLCPTCKNPLDQKPQDIVHKIDALGKKVGGLFGSTLLLSAQKLDDRAKERAKRAKITVLDGENGLRSLSDEIRGWMTSR
ncbi:MAG: DUF1887 family protein, partial [Magnetococcales bacterium]|nr:DUF1887 family protein [Magnetococcales bacterium]